MMRLASTFSYTLLFFLASSILYAAEVKSKSPIDSIMPGEWYEVANSNLSSVAAKPKQNLGDFRSIMRSWNGAAYDTKRDRLIIWGGGHADYGGNEVYVFDVNILKWKRLTEPSPTTLFGGELNKSAGQTDILLNPDHTPVSKHSYDGLEYLPEPNDCLIQFGGSRWYKGGADALVWGFDFVKMKWERRENSISAALTPKSAYDSVSGKWYVQTASSLLEYDPSRDLWTEIGKNGGWSEEGVAEIDPEKSWFVSIENGRIYYYDLKATRPLRRKELLTHGDTEILKAHAPGLAYSVKAKKLVAWSGATSDNNTNALGDSVYVLDTDTLTWKKFESGGRVHPPKAIVGGHGKSYGTFGRWRYIPSKDLFIGVNNVSDNVYLYRLPLGAYTKLKKQ